MEAINVLARLVLTVVLIVIPMTPVLGPVSRKVQTYFGPAKPFLVNNVYP